MAHFLMVPINANGVVIDPNIACIAQNAMTAELGLNEIIIYSHGWSTDADAAMALYNRFSIEFARWLVNNAAKAGLRPLNGPLSVGIHWPSEVSENASTTSPEFAQIIQGIQPLSFYTMEKRADAIGTHGVYALLRQLIQSRGTRPGSAPLRVTFIGHSFGCKVVTSAVEEIYDSIRDPQNSLEAPPEGLELNLVLIQAAFQDTCLDAHQVYGDIANLPIRMLVTTSQKDTALTQAFPLAHKIVDFFDDTAKALGADGPTAATRTAFGGSDDLDIAPGFAVAQSLAARKRLVVADLTKLHQAHPEGDHSWGGHHSDFNHDEVYALIAGFLFAPPSGK